MVRDLTGTWTALNNKGEQMRIQDDDMGDLKILPGETEWWSHASGHWMKGKGFNNPFGGSITFYADDQAIQATVYFTVSANQRKIVLGNGIVCTKSQA